LPAVLSNYILNLNPLKVKENKLLSDGSKLYFKQPLNLYLFQERLSMAKWKGVEGLLLH
jgi:hypothetical protein